MIEHGGNIELSPEERLADIAGRSFAAKMLLEVDCKTNFGFALDTETGKVFDRLNKSQTKLVEEQRVFFSEISTVFDSEWSMANKSAVASALVAVGYQIDNLDDNNFFAHCIAFKFAFAEILDPDADPLVTARTLLLSMMIGMQIRKGTAINSESKKTTVLARLVRFFRGRRAPVTKVELLAPEDEGAEPVDPKKLTAFADYVGTLDLDDDPQKYSAFTDFVDTLDFDGLEDSGK